MIPSYNPNQWDVFISHAWEDKEDIARPLALELQKSGLKVWFDEFTLKVGDSISQSINYGLSRSKYGIVIISLKFLEKDWTRKELAGLFAKETVASKVILPVWHKISFRELLNHYPIIADRLAVNSTLGVAEMSKQLLNAMNLSFSEDEISGLWSGESGRLRILRAKRGTANEYEGDYDWKGQAWVGHIQGTLEDNLFRFSWWWDLSPERGNGYFMFDKEAKSLRGGWYFGFMEISTDDNFDELEKYVHLWSFVKKS